MSGRVLMLNSTYEPLRVVSWRRAVTMLCLGKVEVLRTYETKLRSVSWTVEMPAVIRLVSFVRRHRIRVAFSRRNIFLRDGYRCQYCNKTLPAAELTCDHVIPRSREHSGADRLPTRPPLARPWRAAATSTSACPPPSRSQSARWSSAA